MQAAKTSASTPESGAVPEVCVAQQWGTAESANDGGAQGRESKVHIYVHEQKR
jgi:hypothetical protein